jgi:hypothetical protein
MAQMLAKAGITTPQEVTCFIKIVPLPDKLPQHHLCISSNWQSHIYMEVEHTFENAFGSRNVYIYHVVLQLTGLQFPCWRIRSFWQSDRHHLLSFWVVLWKQIFAGSHLSGYNYYKQNQQEDGFRVSVISASNDLSTHINQVTAQFGLPHDDRSHTGWDLET